METGSRIDNPESSEQTLVRLIKDRGVEDPEVRDLLTGWISAQETEVGSSGDYAIAQVRLELRRANLFFQAGYADAARESFEAAKLLAANYRRDDLYIAIGEEWDGIERLLGGN
ncbi:MAG: hypothetical protein WC734_01360 [Patescibacteria group bacterium]|jgi:hypothetical protein